MTHDTGPSNGQWVTLQAADGHRLKAYRVDAVGAERGRLVLVQEIFGVNRHIRSVCDGYAADGYTVIAPAMFDRIEEGVELGYDEEGIARGRAIMTRIPFDTALLDVAAALEQIGGAGAAAVAGYCWGGSVAWLAASRLPVRAAIAYYGGQIGNHLDEAPRAPTMLHFGETDHAIPLTVAEGVRSRYPLALTHLYAAGHGFNCDERASYDAESAALARRRSLGFLAAVF